MFECLDFVMVFFFFHFQFSTDYGLFSKYESFLSLPFIFLISIRPRRYDLVIQPSVYINKDIIVSVKNLHPKKKFLSNLQKIYSLSSIRNFLVSEIFVKHTSAFVWLNTHHPVFITLTKKFQSNSSHCCDAIKEGKLNKFILFPCSNFSFSRILRLKSSLSLVHKSFIVLRKQKQKLL